MSNFPEERYSCTRQ